MPRALWVLWAIFVALTAQADSETLVQRTLQDPGRRLKLLYVMEYDGKLDWQPIPATWWVPEIANAARTWGTNRREISLKEVLELQLATDAATVWLPKYLLVVYQLTK
ncbi:MAG: hypothetical protein FRX49_04844 [Trebouxia sp. A1-2]|nr:MAG: hypothetical protein FRX49_04844 [Trebouxia sp. A1-2]